MSKEEISTESEYEDLSEEEKNKKKQEDKGMSEYEKQRLSRIADNKARMVALGLHKMASSLMGSVQKSSRSQKLSRRKGKSKAVDDDDDYKPDDDDEDSDDFDGEHDEDFVSQSSSKSGENKVRSKISKTNKNVSPSKQSTGADYVSDDDELMQAIALSLQDSATVDERKEIEYAREDAGRRKRKKPLNNRVQMTEDELILHFFQFDEQGRGFLTIRDLERLATTHDFIWTDRELADMINLFDGDGDGKLNLEDFRKIAARCNMIQQSGSC